jgi:hypothetical protein
MPLSVTVTRAAGCGGKHMLERRTVVRGLGAAVLAASIRPAELLAQAPTTAELTAGVLNSFRKNFADRWIEQNASFFSSYVTADAGGFAAPLGYTGGQRVFVEAKNVKIDAYAATLTRADMANGVDWRGHVGAEAGLVRTNSGAGWTQWRDGPVALYKLSYERKAGRWETTGRIFMDGTANELLRPSPEQIASLAVAPVIPPPNLQCPPWRQRDGRC